MICPKCQKELPENFEGKWCPFCEGWFFGKNAPGLQPSRPARQFQLNGQLFLLALLLPSALTQLAALIFGALKGPQFEGSVSAVVGSLGGIAGGLICGVMAAVSLAQTLPGRILLSILFSVVMIVVCLALCCFGCAVGYGGSRL